MHFLRGSASHRILNLINNLLPSFAVFVFPPDLLDVLINVVVLVVVTVVVVTLTLVVIVVVLVVVAVSFS